MYIKTTGNAFSTLKKLMHPMKNVSAIFKYPINAKLINCGINVDHVLFSELVAILHNIEYFLAFETLRTIVHFNNFGSYVMYWRHLKIDIKMWILSFYGTNLYKKYNQDCSFIHLPTIYIVKVWKNTKNTFIQRLNLILYGFLQISFLSISHWSDSWLLKKVFQ